RFDLLCPLAIILYFLFHSEVTYKTQYGEDFESRTANPKSSKSFRSRLRLCSVTRVSLAGGGSRVRTFGAPPRKIADAVETRLLVSRHLCGPKLPVPRCALIVKSVALVARPDSPGVAAPCMTALR